MPKYKPCSLRYDIVEEQIAQSGIMLLIICSCSHRLVLLPAALATQDSARRHLAAWLKGARYEGSGQAYALQTRTT